MDPIFSWGTAKQLGLSALDTAKGMAIGVPGYMYGSTMGAIAGLPFGLSQFTAPLGGYLGGKLGGWISEQEPDPEGAKEMAANMGTPAYTDDGSSNGFGSMAQDFVSGPSGVSTAQTVGQPESFDRGAFVSMYSSMSKANSLVLVVNTSQDG